MIALILCAGLGTRLAEETKDRPKCMVDICGKPVLERIADHLNKYGIFQIVVNLHSFPMTVIKHFGNRFLYIYEEIPMGEFNTLGQVKNWFPREDIIVWNGDTLTSLDLSQLSDHCGQAIEKGVHMGITVYRPMLDMKPFNVDCWWQDMGTPEGLKLARKHYESH